MGKITTKITESHNYITVDYFIDDQPIDLYVRKKKIGKTVRIRLGDVMISLPNYLLAIEIALAVATMLSIKRR
jgi:hypothetical protein